MLARDLTRYVQVSFLAACFAFLAACPTCGASEESSSPWTREAIVAWLSHQERLVHSIECTFETERSSTHLENVPLIREVCRKLGKENRYISTEEEAKTHDSVTRWMRKGIKERWDSFRPMAPGSGDSPEIPLKILAFDGHLVRDIHLLDEGIFGSIDTIEGASWHAINRTDPSSFTYEYGGTPYSTIVARGSDFNVSMVVDDDRKLTRVSVGHPDFDWQSFVLLFDQENRLVERQDFAQLSPDPAPRLYERHVFSDYRKHEDASGEIIWFPHQAVYHYYMGNLPNGTPVEYHAETTTIREIKFNVDISDDIFVIQFPPGTRIWDGVNGLGYIDSLAERAQDEGLSALADDVLAPQSEPSETSATTSKQPSEVNPEDKIVPASDIPLGYIEEGNQSAKSGKWWAFLGLIIGLLLVASSVIWWLRTRKVS